MTTTARKTRPKLTSTDLERIAGPDPVYWAARLMVAIRERDRLAEQRARERLRDLGYDVRRVRGATA